MKELWIDTYEDVWNECDENTTEERIIALTEERFKERMVAFLESRLARAGGRLN